MKNVFRTVHIYAVVATVLLGLSLGGCGTKPYLVVNTPRPTTAPPPNMARIYFMKPGGSMQKAYTMILENEKVVGYLQNRTVFYLDVPAGEHFFMSVSSITEGLKASLAGGKTYYVRLYSSPGAKSLLLGGSEDVHMEPLVPGTEGWDQRLIWVDGATLITVNPEYAAKWEMRNAANNAERLEKFRSGEAEAKLLGPEQGE